MGLNILLYKITGKQPEETWGGKTVMYYQTEEPKWWDSCRYGGDKDFAVSGLFEYVDKEEEYPEYYRPIDFNKTRNWIKENIEELAQPRLLQAINEMEADENLVFYFSY
jgi:hypothetical protein